MPGPTDQWIWLVISNKIVFFSLLPPNLLFHRVLGQAGTYLVFPAGRMQTGFGARQDFPEVLHALDRRDY